MCPQTVGLVQGALETAGITTTGITNVAEVSQRVGVPRALDVPWPLGLTLGEPGNPALQRAVLEQAEARGIKSGTAKKVFELMAYFAGYGFNKSHSAAYALVADVDLRLRNLEQGGLPPVGAQGPAEGQMAGEQMAGQAMAPGQTVAAGSALMEIISASTLWVRVPVL